VPTRSNGFIYDAEALPAVKLVPPAIASTYVPAARKRK
jgi:hypothetical protein